MGKIKRIKFLKLYNKICGKSRTAIGYKKNSVCKDYFKTPKEIRQIYLDSQYCATGEFLLYKMKYRKNNL